MERRRCVPFQRRGEDLTDAFAAGQNLAVLCAKVRIRPRCVAASPSCFYSRLIDADCLIFPFSGDTASSFLSYNLRPRDVLVCLGSGDLDTVVLPSPHYIPDRAWHMVLNPARASGDSDDGNQYLAVISCVVLLMPGIC